MELESAIPSYLAQERTQPLGAPIDYQPPVAAYSSRFDQSIKDVVIAILGVQHKDNTSSNTDALKKLITFVKDASKNPQPEYWLLASNTDINGAYNQVVIAYWKCKSDYLNWSVTSGFDTWWESIDPTTSQSGWFREVFFPPIERFETVFSGNNNPEGVAHMHEKFSGPVREHVYWGSMRDRMPASQTDALEGEAWKPQTESATSVTDGGRVGLARRVRVPGRKNLAIIRSGQDWSNTKPEERMLYLETLHPVLMTGMMYLRDQGHEVGCISNRFMEVLDHDSFDPKSTMKTFGLGYFDDLNSLEGWSKKHKTHLDIFGRFMQYAKDLKGDMSLQLFHEVLVLEPEQQSFEYINCHSRTGMLATL